MSWIILTPTEPVEARRWTVVFHRKAENRFFSLIALGHFKHVSAFAWLPELGIWVFYDVGFRRSTIIHMADGIPAQATIGNLCKGNALVTIEPRTDGLPLMRWGLFCTTAISHLLGLQCVAYRPDALFNHLVSLGGIVRDDATSRPAARSRRSELAGRTGAGAGEPGCEPAGPVAG